MIRRELQAIHEYGADAYAAADSDEYEYARLLLLKSSGLSIPLAHPFFKNQIKRRIAMITKTNKNKKALLGRFMILPLIALLMGIFSFKMQNHFSFKPTKIIRVVIDAGHGGVFPGVEFNGIYEKNINLSIARKIQSLSKEYQVEVIMTREKDEDAAGSDLKASLDYRTAMAEKTNADLFISIHTNGTEKNGVQDKYSGFEIYVPETTNPFYEGSVKLASSITDYIKKDYTIASQLKQRQDRIQVLHQATVPAILIECGFMDNKSDLNYLQDDQNQEKIARDILEGIRKYSLQSTSYHPVPSSHAGISSQVISNLQVDNNEEIYENANDSSGPYKKVEIEAEYPGGHNAWAQYILRTLNYPKDAVKNSIQGDVVVEFVVKTDGSLTDIRAISGPEELRAESVRVITKSGRWIPAIDHGMKVDSYCKQPINYRLQ
jgi:TonB family protein